MVLLRRHLVAPTQDSRTEFALQLRVSFIPVNNHSMLLLF